MIILAPLLLFLISILQYQYCLLFNNIYTYISQKEDMTTSTQSICYSRHHKQGLSYQNQSAIKDSHTDSKVSQSRHYPFNKAQEIQQNIKYGFLYLIQQCFTIFFFISKIVLAPMIYPLYWGLSFFLYLCKITKIFYTFLLNGIQGVLKTFRKGCFSEKLHYAVLKESGLYLKNLGVPLQDAFTYQLYDYSLRKFMTISRIQEQMKIAEIQPWSHIGMQYMSRVQKLKNISFFHNSFNKVQKIHSKISYAEPILTDYSSQAIKSPHDIFVMFNRSKDFGPENTQIDILKALTYVRRNLNENGYFVFGNAFNNDGEINIFEELVLSFGFKITMKEDVSCNIIHSQKILKKVYKDRKLAWAKQKALEFTGKVVNGDNAIGHFLKQLWAAIQKITGIKYTSSKYLIYILELNI